MSRSVTSSQSVSTVYTSLLYVLATGVIDASTVDAIRDSVVFAFNQSSLATGSSPHQLLRRLKLPDNASIDLLVAGEVFHEVVQMVRLSHQGDSEGGVPMLSECELNVLAELSGCLQHTTGPDCSDSCYHSQYRSIDGSCNNWNHPEWGMTDSPFQRLLAPAYEDGLGLPVGWSGDRPSARLVSQSVIRASSIEPDLETTHMIMQVYTLLLLPLLHLFSPYSLGSSWIMTSTWPQALPVTSPSAQEPPALTSAPTALLASPSLSLTMTLAWQPQPAYPSPGQEVCVAQAPPPCW